LKHQKATEEVFLKYLESIEGKAEWLDGEIYDMAGGSGRHATICGNVGAEIRAALKGKGCTTYAGDLMYRIPLDRSLCFPKASVICGTPEFEPPKNNIARNPTVIVEVLSDETESYCRGGKFKKYRTILTLQEYVLVDQHKYEVEVRFRHPSGLWDIQTFDDLNQNVSLQSLGITIPMAEIYYGIVFE
jgi:Uma2 family endonuclease